MAETTSQSRAAAIAVAVVVFGGIIAGVTIPRVITQHHVEYGSWPEGSDPAARRCVEGTVWLGDDVRQLGRLPLAKDGAAPYCVYRACYDPGDSAIDVFSNSAVVPAGMDPLFAEVETEWQSPWPPLAVWCGGNESDEPPGCACRLASDTTGACEALATDMNGVSTWGKAPPNATLQRGAWRGACGKAPCKVLAGRSYFPSACCIPSCADKQCGSDGCGGTCGTCTFINNTEPAWTAPASCDDSTGRCCVEPPCTLDRVPAPPGWTPPPAP